jgi:hypothetical protein
MANSAANPLPAANPAAQIPLPADFVTQAYIIDIYVIFVV